MLVAGRFDIGERIGAGGMGTVHRALDRHTDETVAVKLLRSAPDSERFLREARLLSEIRHPAVVRYVAHGRVESGELFLAMEWLEGEDLAQRLKRLELTMAESLQLVTRIAGALAAVHAQGIVHRDLKPANLFLPGGDAGRVKLLDFGIALFEGAGSMTRTGAIIGTPGYMAPEQARGVRGVDARADVFSLGCILYRCFTGRAPFAGGDLLAVLAKLVFEDPPRPREIRPEIAPPLDELIVRMLAKPAAERPQDGAAVLLELERIGAIFDAKAAVPVWIDPGSAERITLAEQRLVSVLVMAASIPDGAASTIYISHDATLPQGLGEAMDRFGAQVAALADGSVVATLTAGGEPADQAAQAARCALAMHVALPRQEMVLATGRALTCRLPIGEVVERAVAMLHDTERSREHDPLPPEVRIDETTAGLLGSAFEVGGDARSLVLLREREPLEAAARTLLGKPTPCVGRDRDLAMLDLLWSNCVSEPMASAVLITAPAGVGKSRLRYEFLRRLAGRGERVEVWMSRGDPMGRGSPLRMLAQALRRTFGLHDGEPLVVRQRRIRARLARHLSERDLARASAFLGELCGVSFPDEDSPELRAARRDPVLMGDQMRRAWEDFLDAETREQPLLIVLEDLHWGDLPTVTWIDQALRRFHDRPLLVLALARVEIREIFPQLWVDRDVQEIRLGELGRKAGERLIRQTLGDKVRLETVEGLLDRAAGNAFYLEELIRAVAEGKGNSLPDTVLAMAQARLDRIEPEARRVLRAAGVFGQVFWRGGVAALIGAEQVSHLDIHLGDLTASEVITRRREQRFPHEQEYTFRHGLVRDAAYSMLTEGDRSLGHRLAAEWLEKAGETDALILAEHFEQGNESARAIELYLQAAEQAFRGNDLAATLSCAKRGIAGGASGALLGGLLLHQAEAHKWLGNSVEAIACATEAMRSLESGSARWSRALTTLTLLVAKVGDHERLVALAEELCTHSPDRPSGLHSAALARVASQLFLAGHRDLGDRLLRFAEPLTSHVAQLEPAMVANITRTHAIRAMLSGDVGAYLRLMKLSAESCDRAGDLRSAIPSWSNVAYAYYQLGDYATAERALRDAVAAAERMGLHDVVAVAQHNLAVVLAHLGALPEARAVIAHALKSAVARSHRRLEAASRIYLSIILFLAGDMQGAEREVRAAAEIPTISGSLRAYAQGMLGRVLLTLGRRDEAMQVASEALGFLQTEGVEEGESLICVTYVEALVAVGRSAEVVQALRQARARLLSRAANISDPVWRASFLGKVPDNIRLLDLSRAWLGEFAP